MSRKASPVGRGICLVKASQPGDPVYDAAVAVTDRITITTP